MMNTNISWGQQGWICPQCGSVWAPHVDGCRVCNGGFAPSKPSTILYDEYKINSSSSGDYDYQSVQVKNCANSEDITKVLDNLKN